MIQKLWGDENIYRTLLDNLPQNIFLKDGNSVYLSCNENYARALKIKAEEIVGKTDYEFYPKGLAEKYRADDKRIMESGKAEEIEEKYIQEGKEFIVQTVKTPIKDEQGNVIGILGIFWDITECKRAEEVLRESQERYRALVENAVLGVTVIDTNYKIIMANSMIAKLFNRPASDFVGKNCFREYEKREAVCPHCPGAQAMASGKTTEVETQGVRDDGSRFYVRNRAIPLFRPDGVAKGFIELVEDITERKKAEEALKESRERLELALSVASMGTWRWNIKTDQDTRDASFNSILGLKATESTQSVKDFVQYVHPDDRADVDEEIKRAIRERDIYRIEFRIVRPDGTIYWLSDRGKVYYDQKNEPAYMTGAVFDITDRKRAEEKLKELNHELEDVNQELKNFVYIASHDMREPLRKITAFGAILRQSLKDKLSSDDAENLHFMIDGAERMAKMIEGLLAYSRISTQAQPRQAVDLNEIVKQLQQLELSVLLEEKHATIEIPQPLPCVEADPVQIRQLMQNLIANGVKYQKKGNAPHITITSKPAADGMVRIEVMDNGIGIAPQYLQSIFTMFRRLHSRDEYEGTGIGLAVCKKIVELHGGKISVESQPDKGSTFWFTMPTAEKLTIAATEVESHV